MSQNKKICITFAGAVGSSKTPIANYLSAKLNLPVFNNDAVRTEVIEDLGGFDSEEHIRRRDARLKEIMESEVSFICDSSMDRKWDEFRKRLVAYNYEWFVISLDLSKDLLVKLYKAKGYYESLERIDELINDHDFFLKENGDDAGLRILDTEFKDRLQISYEKACNWMNEK